MLPFYVTIFQPFSAFFQSFFSFSPAFFAFLGPSNVVFFVA